MLKEAQVMRGCDGRVWVNDQKLAGIKSFEAKVTASYEEVDVMGKPGKYQRFVGYEIAGTVTLNKLDSFVVKLLAEKWAKFEQPDITMIAAASDVDLGTERVKFTDVTFDEMSLAQFENKTLTEVEVPFKAGAYQVMDTI